VLHHPLHVGAMGPTPIIEIGRAAIEAATTGDDTESGIRALLGEHSPGGGVKPPASGSVAKSLNHEGREGREGNEEER
jgi:hypothetical protein